LHHPKSITTDAAMELPLLGLMSAETELVSKMKAFKQILKDYLLSYSHSVQEFTSIENT
jgi:hypothetical protein